MPITIAIIGSGPAGFYTASALLAKDRHNGAPDLEIDVIDRLPTPFGLIRAGVAPDHQTIKNVAKTFEQTAHRDEVRYFGHINVGQDVTLDELRDFYDAVVIATGAPLDRPADITGFDKPGVYGAASFVGWYNGHPDWAGLDPDLETQQVAVIGNGNVALDIARVLVKSKDELAKTDIAPNAKEIIAGSSIKKVTIFGRRGPLQTKFSKKELREMAGLEDALAIVRQEQLPGSASDANDRDSRLARHNLETLTGYSDLSRVRTEKAVCFEFYAQPTAILGGRSVTGLRLERTKLEGLKAVGTGEYFDYPCDLVIFAIGYRSEALDGAPYDSARGVIQNNEGRVEDGLYVVGWAKRGSSGVISSNKPDGETCAEQILKDFADGQKPGRTALQRKLEALGRERVSYRDWMKIDQAEIAARDHPAPRKKFIAVQDMLNVLDTVQNQWTVRPERKG